MARAGLLCYTGSRAVINVTSSFVGDGGNLTFDSNCYFRLFGWELLLNVSYLHWVRSDYGTCGSILGEQCIADIKKAVHRKSPWPLKTRFILSI